VEAVAAGIKALLDQAPDASDPEEAPFEDNETNRINQHFIMGGPATSSGIRRAHPGQAITSSIPATS
jgi:hypothetical protein